MKYRILLFVLAYVLNVRVGARSLEIPSGCQKNEKSCAILTQKESEVFQTEGWQLKTAPGASFIKTSLTQIELMRGVFLMTAKKPIRVQTLYGSLSLSAGSVLVEAMDSLVTFTNISSDLKYEPRGEKEAHVLPSGFATYFSNITKTGVADTGYPHPAEIDVLVKSWAKVYGQNERSRFQGELHAFLQNWKAASESVGPWYVDTVKREIAAQEAEEARLARLKAKREEEGQKWRKLFRARNLMNVDPGPTHDSEDDRKPAANELDDL